MKTAGEPPSLGALLRQYRLAGGMTQEQLAERAGLSTRTIKYLEQDRGRTPRQETLLLLADALSLSARERSNFLAMARTGGSAAPLVIPSHGVAPTRGHPALYPLIGRQAVLAQLDGHLRGNGPPLLLLAGEPGIGKTRLLREMAQRGITAGWTVLPGGSYRRGGEEPYAPILQAIQHYLAGQDPLALRRVLEGCGWLARLLPELAEMVVPVPAQNLAPDQERRLIFAAIDRFLANVAGPAGTLLLLDDLQWADPDALDLLAALVRRTQEEHRPRTSLRVVGTYRDTDIRPGDPLSLLLGDLAPRSLIRQLTLGPLNPEEATSLLQSLPTGMTQVDRTTAERVLSRAGGVPYFLVSYAQSLEQGNTDAVPWDLAQGIRQRVSLVPAARDLLGAAAIIGRRVPRTLLATVMGQPEEQMLTGLEAAHAARLLVEEGKDAYTFAHDVIREVVEADLGAARRAFLHRRVAEALERAPRGVPPELLAYHYARSDVEDKALQYLELAADHAAAQYAYNSAEALYSELAGRLQALGRDQEVPGVWEKLGEMLYRAGRDDQALPVLERAAEGYRIAGNLDGEVRLTAQIARACAVCRTAEMGIDRIEALLRREDIGAASPATRSELFAAFDLVLRVIGRYREALAANRQAAGLAGEAGDDRTRLIAAGNRFHLLIKLSRMDEALELGQEILAQAEQLGDPYLLASVHRDLAFNRVAHGDFEIARRHIDRAHEVASSSGNAATLVAIMSTRGWLAFLQGDWQGAREDLERAVMLADEDKLGWYATYPQLYLTHLALSEGDWPAASTAGQQVLAQARQSEDLQVLRWASSVMAELDILQGRPEAALERLIPWLDRAGLEEGDVTDFLPVLAWAHLEAGHIEHAGEVVGQALSRARAQNARPILIEALRVHALISLRQGDRQAAACSLEEGMTLARAMPYPYAEGRLLGLDGKRLEAQGALDLAQAQWKKALDIFQRLGACHDAQGVKQDMAALTHN